MTPAPVTFGPSLFADQPSGKRRAHRSLLVYGSLGVLAAVAVLAIALPFLFPSGAERPRARVRVQATAPGTVYRYFEGSGQVAPVPGRLLKFPVGGKVTRIVSAGTAIGANEILAAVDAARPLLTQLARQRERLAFAEQMTDGMHEAGNAPEEERQASKVQARRDQIAETLRALADKAVVSTAPGVVEESLVHEGDVVEAQAPALRLRAVGYEVQFAMSASDAARARRLAFCQVEADGYLFSCAVTDDTREPGQVRVAIASVPAQIVGRPAHLARTRFEDAVVLPASAFVPGSPRDEVLVVMSGERLASRPVTVAERDPTQAIVVQGLDAGDKVVVDVSDRLHAGDSVSVTR
jgi:multidrug efflux pump subunit AcrA (membrane-fusion protein)